jgi:hypothetical protein
MAAHGRGTALLFARTDTEMFFKSVWAEATGILFLRGRPHFHDQLGRRAPHNSGAPVCLIAYGDRDADRLRGSAIHGRYVSLKDGAR